MSNPENDYVIADRRKNKTEVYIPDDILSRLPTQDEITKIRQLIEQDARTRWFWSSLRTWVLAISSILALFTVGFDGIRTILKRLVS